MFLDTLAYVLVSVALAFLVPLCFNSVTSRLISFTALFTLFVVRLMLDRVDPEILIKDLDYWDIFVLNLAAKFSFFEII